MREGLAPSGPWSPPASVQPVVRYEIAASPLGLAIPAYEAASGVRVAVSLDSIRDIPSPGVSGVFTAEQALRKLLEGTGVTARWSGAASVTLQLRRSEEVEVTAPLLVASSRRYTEPLRDIPQTITVIPRAVIEEQNATTLRDVLRNVPGITIQAGEGGVPAGDNLTIRGFTRAHRHLRGRRARLRRLLARPLQPRAGRGDQGPGLRPSRAAARRAARSTW